MVVTLYSRPGCHLCDEARAVVLAERDRSDFEFVEVDIESSEPLVRDYGLRIPVVAIDGDEMFEYAIDPGAFAALLRR